MSALPPRDELASAYVDGDATPGERAIVEADDALLARVEELRAVRRALAAPVAPRATADVDAAIAAALAGADAAEDGSEEAVAPPVPLGWGGRAPRRRLALAVLGAAAAAIVAIVAVAALRPGDDSSPSAGRAVTADQRDGSGAGLSAGTVAAAQGASGGNGGAATTAATASAATTGPAAASAGSGIALPTLGAVTDADGLRAALAAMAAADRSASVASSAEIACPSPAGQLTAVVEWQGTAAYVFVDPGRRAVVESQATCAELATVPLS